MIFSIRIGSKGTSEESFTLRIPFILSPNQKVQISTNEGSLKVGSFEAVILQEEYFYVLEIYGLPSEEATSQLLPKIASGFYFTTIRHKMGILFAAEPTPITLREKPIVISEKSQMYPQALEKGWGESDGDYDSDKTIIRPEHKKLFAFTMGRPSVIIGIKDSVICKRLTEALAFKNSEKTVSDKKLQLAIEVYSSSFFESSDNAKFLAQVTVLEILKSENRVSSIECDTIDEILEQVKKKRNGLDKKDSNSEYFFLDNLINGIGRLKKQSISKSIQQLVLEKSKFIPGVTDPVAYRDRVKDIYNLRGSLVHDGSADKDRIKKAINFLNDFIPQLLLVLFSEIVN